MNALIAIVAILGVLALAFCLAWQHDNERAEFRRRVEELEDQLLRNAGAHPVFNAGSAREIRPGSGWFDSKKEEPEPASRPLKPRV